MNHEQLYLSILNHIHDGIYYVDTDRTITFWNRAAEEITGFTADEVIGLSCPQTGLHHIDTEGNPLCIIGCPLYQTLADGLPRTSQVFVRHRDGYRIPIHVCVSPVTESGSVIGAVEVFSRNSPAVYEDDLIDRLSDAVMHDRLTGLPGRRYLDQFLRFRLSEYARTGQKFAVLFADIDDFSRVNNTYGHDIGDAVLTGLSRAVSSDRNPDELFGRWGGEEFLGIYPLKETASVQAIGNRLLKCVRSIRVTAGEAEISVTASVGITACRPGETAEELIKRADALMYRAKKSGKDAVFSD